jgi:hypothetical protein
VVLFCAVEARKKGKKNINFEIPDMLFCIVNLSGVT